MSPIDRLFGRPRQQPKKDPNEEALQLHDEILMRIDQTKREIEKRKDEYNRKKRQGASKAMLDAENRRIARAILKLRNYETKLEGLAVSKESNNDILLDAKILSAQANISRETQKQLSRTRLQEDMDVVRSVKSDSEAMRDLLGSYFDEAAEDSPEMGDIEDIMQDLDHERQLEEEKAVDAMLLQAQRPTSSPVHEKSSKNYEEDLLDQLLDE